MNKAIEVGNVVSIETKHLEHTTVTKIRLAVDDPYKKDETDFLDVTVFGRTAENCEKYVEKGRRIGVTGRIKTGQYERDGVNVKTWEIIADDVEFLGGRHE